MKLRTTRNSIRLRLSQTDVKSFIETGFIEETVQIGPQTENAISYRVERSEPAVATTANYLDNRLTILVPGTAADNWSTSEDVGIEAIQPTGNGGELSILIEKDFACLTPRSDNDDKDAFPNPGAACA